MTRLVAAGAAAAIVVVMVGAMSVSTASAAGDATLDAMIVRNPLPGWMVLPSSVLDQAASGERQSLAQVTSKPVSVATEGWRAGGQSLLLVLVTFPAGFPSGNFKAADAVTGACESATNSKAAAVGSYAAIPGASEGTCSGSVGGVDNFATVLSWQRQDIIVLMLGNRMSGTQVESVAQLQDAALPGGSAPTGATPPASASGSNSAYLIGGVIGVALVLGLVAMQIARLRSRKPTPVQALRPLQPVSVPEYAMSAAPMSAPVGFTAAPPPLEPGWHQENGDPSRYAYWDGTRFTGWKRWDGTGWVDSGGGS